jgi:nickel-dependent lactate racemase
MEDVMGVKTIRIPYGCDTVELKVPERNLVGVYSPRDVIPIANVWDEVIRALNHPIGTKPLGELVKGASKVAILADDNTRLTPADKIIPILLDEMNAAGIRDEQFSVIIALGTHRSMTEEEIAVKFGESVVRRVRVTNHDFRDPGSQVDLGKTPSGTSISVNREVYEADFKIGVGSIVPHHIPGFAGGAKIVQPGVCGEKTTAETHLLSVRAPRSYLGVEDNPVRAEMNQIARRIGMNTIFNTVLNRQGAVVRAFFGDTTEAFKVGVRVSKEVYAVEVPEEADIVISSSHPCDLEFWQAHKTLYPSDLAVKAGGTMVIVTPCYEGIAVTHADITDLTGYSAESLRKKVERGEVHDEVAAALAIAWAQVKERESVFFVSQGISPERVKKLGFTPFASAQEAFDAALRKHGENARVSVLTHAPDMLPIVRPAASSSRCTPSLQTAVR